MQKFLSTLFTIIIFTTLSATAEPVVYNTVTGKVHKPTCASAKKCTKNCIKIDRKDAYNKGGVPCKQCGG